MCLWLLGGCTNVVRRYVLIFFLPLLSIPLGVFLSEFMHLHFMQVRKDLGIQDDVKLLILNFGGQVS